MRIEGGRIRYSTDTVGERTGYSVDIKEKEKNAEVVGEAVHR